MKSKMTKQKSFAQQEVERVWGDVPVFDSIRDLRVIIQPCDVESATPKDPGCCVFARACQRSFGSKKVMFLRTVAYVELPDESGNIRVERFTMPGSMRNLINDFDKGKAVIPKGGFLLTAPSLSMSLEGKRSKQSKRDKKMRDAIIKGEMIGNTRVGNQGKGSRSTKPVTIDLEVRNGTGMVHFTNNKG